MTDDAKSNASHRAPWDPPLDDHDPGPVPDYEPTVALPPAVERCGVQTDSGWGCYRPAGHDGGHDPDGYPEVTHDGFGRQLPDPLDGELAGGITEAVRAAATAGMSAEHIADAVALGLGLRAGVAALTVQQGDAIRGAEWVSVTHDPDAPERYVKVLAGGAVLEVRAGGPMLRWGWTAWTEGGHRYMSGVGHHTATEAMYVAETKARHIDRDCLCPTPGMCPTMPGDRDRVPLVRTMPTCDVCGASTSQHASDCPEAVRRGQG